MGDVRYDFTDETVIVTGGSSGIGRTTALAFGEAGATVLNADIRADPKDEDAELPTHERIEVDGGTATYVRTDISDPAALDELVAEARAFGGVDVMVNNAGWFMRAPLESVSPDEFDQIVGINAKGCFFGCKVAATDMRERETDGTIVNIASISSTHAQPKQIPYDATKGAIKMITQGAALELADDDIRVNAVAPGHIATEFGSGAEQKEKSVEAGNLTKPIPLGRPGYPSDIAPAVLYMASDAAEYVTGEMLYVDGGWQAF